MYYNNHDVRVEEMAVSQIGEAFRLVAEARDSIKIIIEPQK
jgi:hypothetical protein